MSDLVKRYLANRYCSCEDGIFKYIAHMGKKIPVCIKCGKEM